jgi:uncharacterized membrane protein
MVTGFVIVHHLVFSVLGWLMKDFHASVVAGMKQANK